MKLAYCFWRIPPGSAVEGAWRRLIGILDASRKPESTILMKGVGMQALFSGQRRLREADYVVCANIWQICVCYLMLLGSKCKIAFWVQGLVAEESSLRHRSSVRYGLLRLIERFCFRISSAYIYVSPYMSEFYAARYSWSVFRPSMVAPCVSELSPELGISRVRHSYCYVGGMSPWQRFEDIIRIMNVVMESQPDAIFNVATREVENCNRILRDKASNRLLRRTTVCCLSGRDEMRRFLSAHEFGLLIREDISVNNVSSPIKLAEYLSCGLSVIGTIAVKSYISALQNAGYLVDLQVLDEANVTLAFDYRGEEASLKMHQCFFSPEAVMIEATRFLGRLER